jgi:hypothetical protein
VPALPLLGPWHLLHRCQVVVPHRGLFRAFESAGSAVTYAINSAATDKKIPLYVNSSLLAATIPCIIALIRMVPEAPSAVDDLVEDAQTVEAATKAE